MFQDQTSRTCGSMLITLCCLLSLCIHHPLYCGSVPIYHSIYCGIFLCPAAVRRSGAAFGQRKGSNKVTQVKRFALAILLIPSALIATAAPAIAQVGLPSEPDQRTLLGLVILSLTLIVFLVIAWYGLMGANGGGLLRRGVSRFLRKTRRRQRRKGRRSYNP